MPGQVGRRRPNKIIISNRNTTFKSTIVKKAIDISYILIPVPEGQKEGLPLPEIEGYQHITLVRVEIDGKDYDRFEYIPDWIDLCAGGNGKRVGNKIHITEEPAMA